MFCTVLDDLKSPANVGMIVRNHVAFGGAEVVFVGRERPWRFKKSTQAFSRKLERLCDIHYIETAEAFFAWAGVRGYTPLAVEISPDALPLPDFSFPARPALVFGSEGRGLSYSFLARCGATLVIPQFGGAECLNVAVSAGVAMYELRRGQQATQVVQGSKFRAGSRTPDPPTWRIGAF